MDPLTPLDTLCRIILRAREYEAQTASDYDRDEDPDNVDDEQEGALSVLEDDINDSIEEELMEQPMLASVLDAGLAAFDLSCAGIGDIS